MISHAIALEHYFVTVVKVITCILALSNLKTSTLILRSNHISVDTRWKLSRSPQLNKGVCLSVSEALHLQHKGLN